MPESTSCNLCGSERSRTLWRQPDYRLRVDDVEWTVVRCTSCGLGYLDPRPTRTEVDRYYPTAYFAFRGEHEGRYRRLANHVPGRCGRLLDIGTADGGFLAVMRDQGWEVEGIERFDAGNPHGLTIHRFDFPDECDLPHETFDVVTAWAVFEHLHDPASAFAEAARLLRPGGHLVLQVPNLRSIQGRWSRQEDIPRHLFFFDPSTLTRYGASAGLQLEHVTHTTDLFGGSGRGVLCLGLVRALGRSTREFFEIYYTPRGARFRRWPLLAPVWTLVAALERVVLADRLVVGLRLSGQIVAQFAKPLPPGSVA